MADEEIYDDGGEVTPTPEPKVKPKPPTKPVNSVKAEVGMTLKQRLALLEKEKENKPSLQPKPITKPKPAVDPSSKPSVADKPISVKPSTFNKVPRPSLNPGIPSLAELKSRQKSLKVVSEKRESLLQACSNASNTSSSDTDNQNDTQTYTDNDKKVYKKLKFTPKPRKPTKPELPIEVVLPIVQYFDVENDVNLRLGAGRDTSMSSESLIKSYGEEDELEEVKATAPMLPNRPRDLPVPQPPLPSRGHVPLPPAPVTHDSGSAVDQSLEELYDDAAAGTAAAVKEDDMEVYEAFDEVEESAPPPIPTSSHGHAPTTNGVHQSPESTKKETKEEKKERLRLEKLEKEREKARLKEAKDQEALLKKLKVKDEELTSSDFLRVKADHSGGKMMLTVKANEKLALIRKTDCPAKKWIAKNLNSQLVGLVDIDNVEDLQQIKSPTTNGYTPNDVHDGEDIYEELDNV